MNIPSSNVRCIKVHISVILSTKTGDIRFIALSVLQLLCGSTFEWCFGKEPVGSKPVKLAGRYITVVTLWCCKSWEWRLWRQRQIFHCDKRSLDLFCAVRFNPRLTVGGKPHFHCQCLRTFNSSIYSNHSPHQSMPPFNSISFSHFTIDTEVKAISWKCMTQHRARYMAGARFNNQSPVSE